MTLVIPSKARNLKDANNRSPCTSINNIYIVTNPERTVLYIGVTNNLDSRLAEHFFNKGNVKTFAGKFYCYNLVYFEEFQYINDAIAREKELKGWSRAKKEGLIKTKNPDWTFFNNTVCRCWPPKEKPGRY
jgi:putative endonuclease